MGEAYLVPENGQPFFEGELEPVPAGHSVARPVVEVLVSDDTLNTSIVQVSGCCRACQDQTAVEDIERSAYRQKDLLVDPALLPWPNQPTLRWDVVSICAACRAKLSSDHPENFVCKMMTWVSDWAVCETYVFSIAPALKSCMQTTSNLSKWYSKPAMHCCHLAEGTEENIRIFHGSHIEICHADNIKLVQVVLQTCNHELLIWRPL